MTELQRTAQWFSDRIGHLTASRMRSARKKLKNGNDSQERFNLKVEICSERINDAIVNNPMNEAMQWGIDQEPYAKEYYKQIMGVEVQDVGFIKHPTIEYLGASPDGFVSDGLVEFKCPTTATHLKYIMSGKVPDMYKDQMALQCIVTGKKWCDFVSFDPRLKSDRCLFVRRYYPDTEYCNKLIADAIEFLNEVDIMFDAISTTEMIDF